MRTSFISSVAAVAVAFVLVACGGQAAPAATVAPTVPPTSTPAPTNTPAPTSTPAPTATQAASGGANAASGEAQQAVAAAMANIEQAKSYRMSMVATVKGNLGESIPGATADKPFEFLNVEGVVSDKNSNFTMKGLVVSFLGGDPDTGIEFATVNEKSYVRGPVPLLNANEDKWYILPADQSSPAEQFGSASVVKTFASEDMDLSDFVVEGTESLDGQTCTIYAGDKEATMKAFSKSQGTEGLPSVDSLKEVDQASLKFYICDDDLLHRMTLSFLGTPEDQTDKLEINLNVNLNDFGKSFDIEEPTDAEPIATPTP